MIIVFVMLDISTERKLTTLKLSPEARKALGSNLSRFEKALEDRSIMDLITVVTGPLDVIAAENLLLPEEYYSVYNMNSTESTRLCQLKRLLGSSELPEVTKDSVILILAVFNMCSFGGFSHDPTRFLENA